MKKLTLIALGAAVAASAAAQDYTVDPSNELVLAKNVSEIDYIVLADAAVAQFQAKGAKVQYVGPSSEEGRNLWYWDGLKAGDESMPRVDFEEGGYISVEVTGTAGWSGAGLAVDVPGINLTGLNDDTRFHLAYMAPSGTGPESIALILLDKAEFGSMPAKVALGANYNDNGVIFPSIAPRISAEWQGIDISVGELKKLWPSFNPGHLDGWQGNLMSWLSGNVAGTTLAFDAVYFYNVGGSGVEGVADDSAADFTVTRNTINALGGNGIELYDLAGKLVKSTEGCTMGINGLDRGVYVVKSGNTVRKVAL